MLTEQASQIARRAQDALNESPHIGLRGLKVESREDRLYISGHVATFYQKQQAQELVRATIDDCVVVNEIEVS